MTSITRLSLAPLVCFLALSGPTLAGVFTVDSNGMGNFTTIRDAVNAASDGDTILVRSGQYFDSIHIDGKSLAILAQDPSNPPRILADFGPEVFIVENLAEGQEVLLEGMRLMVDGWFQNLSAYKGSLTIRNCAGSVRVQRCDLIGADAMCGGGASACNQIGALHVANSVNAVFVDCTILAGAAICWEDAKGTVSCGGALDPALVVDGAGTRVALYDSHVLGAAGRYPQDPDDYDGWDGGTAAEINDGFLFASNTIIEGGRGSDAKDSPMGITPGVGGDGGAALVLSNATVKELNSMIKGGAAGLGGQCTSCNPPIAHGADGQPGANVIGCCVDSLTGPVRTARAMANQILPGMVEITFSGVPGDTVDIASSELGAFLYQPQRLGVFGLATPVTLLSRGTGLGVIPVSGELTLTTALPAGAVQPDYLLHLQPIFTATSGDKALGPPLRILDTDACQAWVHCVSLLNSTGVVGTLGVTGTYSVAANDTVLVARHLPTGEMGMFFYGHAAPNFFNAVGDGYLCVQAPLFRLQPALQASILGTVSLPIDQTLPPMNAGPGAIQVGQRVYFQYVYRDAQSPGNFGFNFTNGVTAEFCP